MRNSNRISSIISQKLRLFQIAILFGMPIFAGAVTAVSAGLTESYSDKSFVSALVPHIAVLLETNEEIEIQRLVHSASLESDKVLQVIRDGKILASSEGVSELGLQKAVVVTSGPISFADSRVTTVSRIRRSGGPIQDAFLLVSSPLSSFLKPAAVVFAPIFILSLLLSFLLPRLIENAVTTSVVEPLERISDGIKSIALNDDLGLELQKAEEIGRNVFVEELKVIAEGLAATLMRLKSATDQLIESRAVEKSGQLYRQLIHDLHTPVTALREFSRISSDENVSAATRKNALSKIPELAEQVLNQVGAGRANLNNTYRPMPNADLVESVSKTAERAALTASSAHSCEVIVLVPNEKVRISHDPILLERAVANLILNAAEASSTRVEVAVANYEGRPVVRVSDNGPGMKPGSVATYLLGHGRSSKGDRQALGLSGCNHIVKTHGAKLIHRRSHLGGSEFEIRF